MLLFGRLLLFPQPLVFAQALPQAAQAAEAVPKRWLLQAAGISQ
jgi:hypothetical protein